jgi:hypothetical protein
VPELIHLLHFLVLHLFLKYTMYILRGPCEALEIGQWSWHEGK